MLVTEGKPCKGKLKEPGLQEPTYILAFSVDGEGRDSTLHRSESTTFLLLLDMPRLKFLVPLIWRTTNPLKKIARYYYADSVFLFNYLPSFVLK